MYTVNHESRFIFRLPFPAAWFTARLLLPCSGRFLVTDLTGVSGRHRGCLFPENEHFSRPPKEGDNMAVFRIEKTRDYTVRFNHHLRNAGLSLKSKGLLSMMLSLPEGLGLHH